MKVMKKLLIVLMLLLLLLGLMQNVVMAAEAFSWSSKISEAASATSNNGAVTATKTIGGSIVTITKVICLGVAIVMLIVLAMKYMMAAPGEKASIKKSAVTYVVGAIIMFAAAGLLTIIQQFAGAITATAAS